MPFLSFTDQYLLAHETTKVPTSDTVATTRFKRDINTGAAKLASRMDRSYTRQTRYADIAEDTQYYQYPKDAVRVIEVLYLDGTQWRPLRPIDDNDYWAALNQSPQTGDPTHYFVKGHDEVGLFPIPGAAVTAGLQLVFQPKVLLLTAADYTDGTITATEGSTTITHSGTGFTESMVGRAFEVTDGSDGNFYRIADFTSTSALVLDNVFQGVSGSGLAFRIGEIFDLPEEFLESPVDYACYRYYVGRNRNVAGDFKDLFDQAMSDIRNTYGKTRSSVIVEPSGESYIYDPLRDTPRSIG